MASPDAISRLNAVLSGRYEVERELAEGGMATVYLAKDLKHHRGVALKVLKPDLAAAVGSDRFLAEIQTTANLQHPNILPLFDSGDVEGVLFYVMPYVEGESIRDRLQRETQLPVEDAVRIAIDLAEALDYAHRQGVVHRDVKPANVMLADGRPVIADFGVAIAVQQSSPERLTASGLAVGTPQYMSPEQASGDAHVGPASDIYALGCVLYEMLAGRPPHEGSSVPALVARILTTDPESVTAHRRSVPPHLEAVIAKALERLPADRFRSGKEFARALADPGFRYAPSSVDAGATQGGDSLWNPLSIAMTVVVVALLGVLGVVAFGDAPPEGEPRRYTLGLGESRVGRPDFGDPIDLSPDGTTLAYVGPVAEGSSALWVLRIDELRPRRITGLDAPTQAFFSPDGQQLAVTGQLRLRFVPVSGGPVREVDSPEIFGLGGHWGDEESFYYVSEMGLGRYSVSDGTWEGLGLQQRRNDPLNYPHALPGGRGVVFAKTQDGERVVAVLDLRTDEEVVLTEGVRAGYLPSGHLWVARTNGEVVAAPFDVEDLSLSGPLVTVLDGVRVGFQWGMAFSVAANGDLLYMPAEDGGSNRELIWVDRDGEITPIDPTWSEPFEGVTISPDQSTLAVALGTEVESSIWLRRLDGTPARRLTFAAGGNRRPQWLPDGQSVAFISDRTGVRTPFVRRADGAGDAEILFEVGRDIDQAVVHEDGWVAFRTGFGSQPKDVYARRLVGDTTSVPVSNERDNDEVAPAISPDGRFVAYVAQTPTFALWVRTFPDGSGGRWLVAEGGTEPRWSDDGREIFYRGESAMFAAQVETGSSFEITAVEELFSTAGFFRHDVDRAYDVTRDGQRFAMIRYPAALSELVIVEGFDQIVIDAVEGGGR